MAANAIFVEVKPEGLSGARFPTLPILLRFETDDAVPESLLVDPVYLGAVSEGRTALAGPRWDCEIGDDGRLGTVAYKTDRDDPETPYDEFRSTLVTVTLFAERLGSDDPRRFGLLVGCKSLLSFWRSDEGRLRDALSRTFDATLV